LSNKQINQSWVSKNPKKTGLLVSFIILFSLLFILDRTISYIKPTEANNKPNIVRAINLRENHPGLDVTIHPDDYYLSLTDNLIVQDYPFRIDNNGFILPHNSYENPDHTIAFLGGSTTECMYVTENKRFPYLVGKLIEEKTNKLINSYNSGASGNNMVHSMDILLNKIMPMKPDIVVMMEAINDYTILAYDHTYWPKGTTRSELITINDYFPKVKKETFFWHFKGLFKTIFPNIYYRIFLIKERVLRPSQQKEPYDEWAGRRQMIKDRDFEFMKKEYKWILELTVRANKTHNIIPVLMTQANRFKDIPDDFILKILEPMLNGGISYATFKEEYDTFNEIIREVAKSQDIPLIDLAKLVPQEKEYMYDTLHYNDFGSQFVANIIAEKLIEITSKL